MTVAKNQLFVFVYFTFLFLVSFFVFHVFGYDGKIIDFSLALLFMFFCVSRSVRRDYIFLALLFLSVIFFSSFFVFNPVVHIFYGCAFSLFYLFTVAGKRFDANFDAGPTLFFLSVLIMPSLLMWILGRPYYDVFTIPISIVDIYWAVFSPIVFIRGNIYLVIGMVFVSLAYAFFHDANAVFVMMVVYILLRMVWFSGFIRSLCLFFAYRIWVISLWITVFGFFYFLFVIYGDFKGDFDLYNQFKGEVAFYKRLALIIQGMLVFTENPFFGVGLGVDNYLSYSQYLHNTPQILPITVGVYSGFFGLIVVTCVFTVIFRAIIMRSTDKALISLCLLGLFSFLFIHEYIFNPLIYLPLIILLKKRDASP